MSALAVVTSALERQDCRRQGRDWTCPVHEDSSPSLTVSEGDDGRVLLHCHAGCDTADILARLELTAGDLFEPTGNGNGRREIVATYDYTDSAGQLLFQVVRFAPKDFRQLRPDGRGGWEWRLGDVERVLYRLPKVLAAVKTGTPVYVVEGEKDVHALEKAGFTATCNSGGAGKWQSSYSDVLRGAPVVVIADRDEPGLEHAREVAKSLSGIAATVEVKCSGEGMGKDAAEHLAAGRGAEEFVAVNAMSPADTAPPTEISEPVQLVPALDLLERVQGVLRRYVILPSAAAYDAIALYTLHTWAIEAAYATPYLLIVSPEKQAGKSRLARPRSRGHGLT